MIDVYEKTILETAVQFFSFIIAIWGISHQMKKHRELQKEKYKVELQLKTYEKITDRMPGCSPTGVSTTLNIILDLLNHAGRDFNESKIYVPPPFSPNYVDDDYRVVHKRLWEVASVLEKYEIVLPNMSLFRGAFVKKINELNDAYLPIINVLPYVLISEGGISEVDKLIILSQDDVSLLKAKVDRFADVAYDIAAFLHDLQVEAQNSLLGDYFGRKVAIRIPTKDSHIVLTSEDDSMLQRVRRYVS